MYFINSEGAARFAKKALEEENYRRQYISNLSKLISFFDDIKPTHDHMDFLKRTPFYTNVPLVIVVSFLHYSFL